MRASLRVRFLVVMVLGCVVFSAVVLRVVDAELRSALRGRARAVAVAQAAARAEELAEHVLVDDEIGVRVALLAAVEENADWDCAELRRPALTLHACREAGGARIGTGPAPRPGDFAVSQSILDGRPGLLVVGVSSAADHAAATAASRHLLALLVALSAGGVGAAALFGHWLTAPLVTMAAEVRRLGRRERATLSIPQGEGELTVLAEALDTALRQLAEAMASLEANQRRMFEVEKLAALGSLAAGVAHEVANPLAGARACVDRLARSDTDPDRRERYLAAARDALDRAHGVLRQLSAYGRPDLALPAPTDPRATVEAVVALVHPGIRAELRVEGGPDLEVRWPRSQVQQILTNLVLNAAQAEAETVRLRWAVEGERLHLEVVDDGRGIPEAVRARVFEPFFTTRPVGEGTGLGLSVSLALARTMGGWIELSSPAEGRGTVARLTLPTHVTPPDVAPHPAG